MSRTTVRDVEVLNVIDVEDEVEDDVFDLENGVLDLEDLVIDVEDDSRGEDIVLKCRVVVREVTVRDVAAPASRLCAI